MLPTQSGSVAKIGRVIFRISSAMSLLNTKPRLLVFKGTDTEEFGEKKNFMNFPISTVKFNR